MNKQVARALRDKAEEVATNYSNPSRALNHNQETFKVESIKPLSEFTAVVTFKKEPTLKYAIAFFYFVNASGGRWNYFFPSDSHIIGFEAFGTLKRKIEDVNFSRNFEEES